MRQLVRAASHARELRRRKPPPIRVESGAHQRPTVYYLAPDLATPSGGVRNIYRHVDALNALGIDAAVMHTKAGFRCGWFPHHTRTVAAAEVTVRGSDILVIPEWYSLHQLPRGPRKVVFNQGVYHTFDYVPFEGTAAGAPYAAVPDLVALLAVSEDNEALLRYTFPAIPVHRCRPVVDSKVFHPRVGAPGRRVAFLLNRRAAEREHLLHMLRARGVLDGWELVPIEGRSETEAAALMRECAIFFSFSDREGFGLPPAEAMASGCYVVGFSGLGGREFFDPEHCSPVAENDLLAFAGAAEAAMTAFAHDPEEIVKAGRVASERILARYSDDGLRDDLLACYGQLL